MSLEVPIVSGETPFVLVPNQSQTDTEEVLTLHATRDAHVVTDDPSDQLLHHFLGFDWGFPGRTCVHGCGAREPYRRNPERNP